MSLLLELFLRICNVSPAPPKVKPPSASSILLVFYFALSVAYTARGVYCWYRRVALWQTHRSQRCICECLNFRFGNTSARSPAPAPCNILLHVRYSMVFVSCAVILFVAYFKSALRCSQSQRRCTLQFSVGNASVVFCCAYFRFLSKVSRKSFLTKFRQNAI